MHVFIDLTMKKEISDIIRGDNNILNGEWFITAWQVFQLDQSDLWPLQEARHFINPLNFKKSFFWTAKCCQFSPPGN